MRTIKSRRMIWTEHVARIGNMRDKLVRKPVGTDDFEDLGIDGKIKLKFI
jgi:hypothetical protein